MTFTGRKVYNDLGEPYFVAKTTISNLDYQGMILVDSSGLPIGVPPSAVSDGRKTVSTPGVRVTLATISTACKKVDITAFLGNTGIIVVGGATCVAASGARQGYPLAAGDSYFVEIDDLAKIYIDSTVSLEGVSFTYYS